VRRNRKPLEKKRKKKNDVSSFKKNRARRIGGEKERGKTPDKKGEERESREGRII